jgi:hypothetical protein
MDNLSMDRMATHDGAAYELGDLRDDGVAEGSQTVHPSGNPMSHSTHVGFSEPPSIHATSLNVVPECPVEPSPSFAVAFRALRLSADVGVGRKT